MTKFSSLETESLFESGPANHGEVRILQAVVVQAFYDLVLRPGAKKRNEDDIYKQEAINFFLSTSGPWYQQRVTWAELLGDRRITAERLRQRAIEILGTDSMGEALKVAIKGRDGGTKTIKNRETSGETEEYRQYTGRDDGHKKDHSLREKSKKNNGNSNRKSCSIH